MLISAAHHRLDQMMGLDFAPAGGEAAAPQSVTASAFELSKVFSLQRLKTDGANTIFVLIYLFLLVEALLLFVEPVVQRCREMRR